MRPVGTLLPDNNTNTAPAVVLVAYKTSTRLPIIALMQEAPTTDVVGTVLVRGRDVSVDFTLDQFNYTEQAPTGGGGLIRRNITCTVLAPGDSLSPRPYVPRNEYEEFWRRLYTGGTSSRAIYFEAYLIDRRYQYSDVTLGLTLGVFRLDPNISWDEAGVTSLALYDAVLAEDSVAGATENSIADSIYIFNPWYDGDVFPMAYGRVPRVRTLNAVPGIDTRDLSSALNGRLESNITAATTEIILETNATAGSPLLQLAEVGSTIKILIGPITETSGGEVIEGKLFYDVGAEEIRLINITRNVPYDTAKGYTYAPNGDTPEDWGISNAWPSEFSLRQIVVVNARQKIQAANGWATATINFFDATNTPLPMQTVTNKKFQLEGFGTVEGTVRHSPIKPLVLNTSDSSLSLAWDADPTIDGGYVAGPASVNNLYFLNAYKTLKLYFVDPDIGPQDASIGDSWAVVNLVSDLPDFACYIRNGLSSFSADHVYAEGDGRLVKVPSNYVTVTDGVTRFGIDDLVEFKLTDAPVNLSIGATSNIVYVDCLHASGNDARSERLLERIIEDHSQLVWRFLGSSFLQYIANDNLFPWMGVVLRGRETVSELIDRWLFQMGARLDWEQGSLEISLAGVPAKYILSKTYENPVASMPMYTYTNFISQVPEDSVFLVSMSMSSAFEAEISVDSAAAMPVIMTMTIESEATAVSDATAELVLSSSIEGVQAIFADMTATIEVSTSIEGSTASASTMTESIAVTSSIVSVEPTPGICNPTADLYVSTHASGGESILTDPEALGFDTAYESSRVWYCGTNPEFASDSLESRFLEAEVLKEDQNPGDIAFGVTSKAKCTGNNNAYFPGYSGSQGCGYLSNGDYWNNGVGPADASAGSAFGVNDVVAMSVESLNASGHVRVRYYVNGEFQFEKDVTTIGVADIVLAWGPTNSGISGAFAKAAGNVGQRAPTFHYEGLPTGIKHVSGCLVPSSIGESIEVTASFTSV